MDQLKGEQQLAFQSGSIGYFAEVALEGHIEVGDEKLSILFPKDISVDPWKESIVVGIRTAYRHLPGKLIRNKSVTIRVASFDSKPADTTDITVVYATALAVFNMFNVRPQKAPVFVESFGLFVFDK